MGSVDNRKGSWGPLGSGRILQGKNHRWRDSGDSRQSARILGEMTLGTRRTVESRKGYSASFDSLSMLKGVF